MNVHVIEERTESVHELTMNKCMCLPLDVNVLCGGWLKIVWRERISDTN